MAYKGSEVWTEARKKALMQEAATTVQFRRGGSFATFLTNWSSHESCRLGATSRPSKESTSQSVATARARGQTKKTSHPKSTTHSVWVIMANNTLKVLRWTRMRWCSSLTPSLNTNDVVIENNIVATPLNFFTEIISLNFDGFELQDLTHQPLD